jgi:hypothetical protein
MKRAAENAFIATGPLVRYGEEIPPYDQQENCPINVLTKEAFFLIRDQLRARDLLSLEQTCKHIKTNTANALIWKKLYEKMVELGSKMGLKESYKKTFLQALDQKNTFALLSQIYFESENIYKKRNIPKALEMGNMICVRTRISESIRNQTILKYAELILAQKPILEENIKIVKDSANEILNKDTTSENEKAVANYLKAMATYLMPYQDDDDKEIFVSLNKARLNENLPELLRIEAEIGACILVLNEKVTESSFKNEGVNGETNPFFPKEEAIQNLIKILHNNQASIDQRASVAIILAKEFYKERTDEMDRQADNLLYGVINDPDVSEGLWCEAAFNLVVMCYEHRTKLIDDKTAVEYLLKIKECDEVDIDIRQRIDFYLGLFRFENRTEIITDDKAFDLFWAIDENEELETIIRYKASFYQAVLRYEGRTDRITNDEAIEKLNCILNDPIDPKLTSRASFYLALMLYHTKKDDKRAYELFDTTANKENANKNDREQSRKFREIMLNSGRGPSYTDNPNGNSFTVDMQIENETVGNR